MLQELSVLHLPTILIISRPAPKPNCHWLVFWAEDSGTELVYRMFTKNYVSAANVEGRGKGGLDEGSTWNLRRAICLNQLQKEPWTEIPCQSSFTLDWNSRAWSVFAYGPPGGFLHLRCPEWTDSQRMSPNNASSYLENLHLWRKIQAMCVYVQRTLTFSWHALNRFCFINIIKIDYKHAYTEHTHRGSNNSNKTPPLNFQLLLFL